MHKDVIPTESYHLTANKELAARNASIGRIHLPVDDSARPTPLAAVSHIDKQLEDLRDRIIKELGRRGQKTIFTGISGGMLIIYASPTGQRESNPCYEFKIIGSGCGFHAGDQRTSRDAWIVECAVSSSAYRIDLTARGRAARTDDTTEAVSNLIQEFVRTETNRIHDTVRTDKQ